jgi:hypothetical protein
MTSKLMKSDFSLHLSIIYRREEVGEEHKKKELRKIDIQQAGE